MVRSFTNIESRKNTDWMLGKSFLLTLSAYSFLFVHIRIDDVWCHRWQEVFLFLLLHLRIFEFLVLFTKGFFLFMFFCFCIAWRWNQEYAKHLFLVRSFFLSFFALYLVISCPFHQHYSSRSVQGYFCICIYIRKCVFE